MVKIFSTTTCNNIMEHVDVGEKQWEWVSLENED
jgi:hypothetical protein